MLPHFIGIGAPRCGTRWLAHCLSEHPEIALPPVEAYFFTRRRVVWSHWTKGLDWYQQMFEACAKPGTKVLGEITPVYIFDEDTPELIHKVVPDVKLICCLRDQCERVQSWYKLFLRYNPDLFSTQFSLRQFLTYVPEVYAREGFYLEHLQRYFALFPQDSILILLYDDLVADPTAYIKRVLDFLGVDSANIPPSTAKQINSMSEELVFNRSLQLRDIATRLKERNFNQVAALINSFNTIHVQPHQFPVRHKLSPELRDDMVKMFEDHNKKLGEFLGRDLSHWNREQPDSAE